VPTHGTLPRARRSCGSRSGNTTRSACPGVVISGMIQRTGGRWPTCRANAPAIRIAVGADARGRSALPAMPRGRPGSLSAPGITSPAPCRILLPVEAGEHPGGGCQHRDMGVVPSYMHDPVPLAAKGRASLLLERQCNHVTAGATRLGGLSAAVQNRRPPRSVI
jgi:hypothetical protein